MKLVKRIAFMALALVMLLMASGLAEDISKAVKVVSVSAEVDYAGEKSTAAITLTYDEDGCEVLKYEGNAIDGLKSLLLQIGAEGIVIDNGEGAIELTTENLGQALGMLLVSAVDAETLATAEMLISYMKDGLDKDAEAFSALLSTELSRILMLSMQKGLFTYTNDGSMTFSANISQMCDLLSAYLTSLAADADALSIISGLKLWEMAEVDASQIAAALPELLLQLAQNVGSAANIGLEGEVYLKALSNGNITFKASFATDVFALAIDGQVDDAGIKFSVVFSEGGATLNESITFDGSKVEIILNIDAGEEQYLHANFTIAKDGVNASFNFRDDEDIVSAEIAAKDGVGTGSFYSYESPRYYYDEGIATKGELSFDLNKKEFSLSFVPDENNIEKLEVSYAGGVFNMYYVEGTDYRGNENYFKLNVKDETYYLNAITSSRSSGVYSFDAVVCEYGTEVEFVGTCSCSNGVITAAGDILTKFEAGAEALHGGDFSFNANLTGGLPTYSANLNIYDIPENPDDKLLAFESYFDGTNFKLEYSENGHVEESITASLVNLDNEKYVKINVPIDGDVKTIVVGIRDIVKTNNSLSATLFLEGFEENVKVGSYEAPVSLEMADANHLTVKAEFNGDVQGMQMKLFGAVLNIANEYAAPASHISGMVIPADRIYALIVSLLG